MKTIKLFTIIFALFLVEACGYEAETVVMQPTNTNDTLSMGCLGSYDINPGASGERINTLYGKEKIKHGHWITFNIITSNDRRSGNTKETNFVRSKIEEGYYRHNKKEGFWKFYNNDGTLRDSVNYKNNIPIKD